MSRLVSPPLVWLVAHIDSKSQPVSSGVRTAGVGLLTVAIVGVSFLPVFFGPWKALGIVVCALSGGGILVCSTVGSILGAFATAFFLIPTVPTRPILFGIGSALLGAALVIPAPRALRRLAWAGFLGAAGVLVFLVGPGIAKAPGPAGTLLFEKETAYHRIRVVDQGLRRALYFDKLLQGFAPVRPGVVLGLGVTDGLALSFAFTPDATPAILHADDDPHTATRWSVHALNAPEGFASALVVEGQDVPLQCWRWPGENSD